MLPFQSSSFASTTLTLALLAVPLAAAAGGWRDTVPFDEASIYFELNDTDGDLGIHGFVDGDAWRSLSIEDPRKRKLLSVWARGQLGHQGLTELFFESEEPDFDELPPTEFFERFQEGTYRIRARTLEDERLESAVEVSHVMPEPAPNLRINGVPAAEDCDAEDLPVVSAPVVVEWDPVTMSHPSIGTPGEPVLVEEYQVFVELEDESAEVSANLPPTALSYDVPASFTALGEEFKVEVLTRGDNGNQTATETCYIVE